MKRDYDKEDSLLKKAIANYGDNAINKIADKFPNEDHNKEWFKRYFNIEKCYQHINNNEKKL